MAKIQSVEPNIADLANGWLKSYNFDAFIEKVKQLQLSQEEIEKLREHREQEINASLVKLNNDIYNNEKGLSERDRVYLVAASIIATLGVPGKVAALEKSELKSSTEEGNRDGDIILRKIKAFLGEKNLPQEKRDLIVRTLQNTLTTDNINKVEDGESQLKRVFTKIIDDLGIYYKIGLSTDFTGKLFNEMLPFCSAEVKMVCSLRWHRKKRRQGFLPAAVALILCKSVQYLRSP